MLHISRLITVSTYMDSDLVLPFSPNTSSIANAINSTLQVRSFRLSPGQLVENPKRGGIIDVDGEVIARGEGAYGRNKNQDVMAYGPSVQMTVHQGLATVYCPK
jgi:hypothetical protein